MKELIESLEEKINLCTEFGDMEKEKWAFGIAIKKVRELDKKIECYPKGFLEWVAENYVWLNGIWVHKFVSQIDKNNHKTTQQFVELYLQL